MRGHIIACWTIVHYDVSHFMENSLFDIFPSCLQDVLLLKPYSRLARLSTCPRILQAVCQHQQWRFYAENAANLVQLVLCLIPSCDFLLLRVLRSLQSCFCATNACAIWGMVGVRHVYLLGWSYIRLALHFLCKGGDPAVTLDICYEQALTRLPTALSTSAGRQISPRNSITVWAAR